MSLDGNLEDKLAAAEKRWADVKEEAEKVYTNEELTKAVNKLMEILTKTVKHEDLALYAQNVGQVFQSRALNDFINITAFEMLATTVNERLQALEKSVLNKEPEPPLTVVDDETKETHVINFARQIIMAATQVVREQVEKLQKANTDIDKPNNVVPFPKGN